MSDDTRGPWLAPDWAWMVAEPEVGDPATFVPAAWADVPDAALGKQRGEWKDE